MGLEKLTKGVISWAGSLDGSVLSVGKTAITIDDNAPSVQIQLSPINPQSLRSGGADVAQDSTVAASYKIETNRVIPYSSAHLQDYYMDSMLDLIDAKKLEAQLDEAILTQLYSIATGPVGDTESVLSITDRVDQEVETTAKIISAVESLMLTYEQISIAFDKSRQVENVTESTLENINFFGIDPIILDETNELADYQQLVANITSISIGALQRATSTQLYLQCLYDAAFALRFGASASYFLGANARTVPNQTGTATVSDPWAGWAAVKTRYHDLRQLDQQGTVGFIPKRSRRDDEPASRYDGLKNEDPFSQLSGIAEMDSIRKVGYYCTTLSREFLLSVGLGRLSGTPIGQKFGASAEDPFKRLLGAQGMTAVYTTKVPPDSLAAFAVVQADGSLDVTRSSGQKVYLLENTKHQTTEEKKAGCTTAKKLWINTVKSNPFANEMGIFDDVLQTATDRFAEAQQYIGMLLSRDQERTLLTPRGLFTRVLKDFATIMESLTVPTPTGAAAGIISELAILSVIAEGVAPGYSGGAGQAVTSRRLARRTWVLFIGDEAIRRSAQDLGEMIRNVRGPKVLKIVPDLATWANDTDLHAHFRALARDIEVLGDVWNPTVRFPARAQARDPGSGWNMIGAGVPGENMIYAVKDSGGASVRIKGLIIKIFEDLQAEAQALVEVDDESKSYLRAEGSTLNASFDGSTCFAILLNCFIELTKTFVDMRVMINRTRLPTSGMAHWEYAAPGAFGSEVRENTLESRGRNTAGQNAANWNQGVDSRNNAKIAAWARSQGILNERIYKREARADDAVERFLKNTHEIFYKGSPTEDDPTNRTRKFLVEVVAASEGDDLSGLIDSEGFVSAVGPTSSGAGMPSTGEQANIAVNGHVTPLSLIEMMEELAQQDDAVTDLLSVPKALIENLVSNSANLSEKAAVLRSATTSDITADMQILRDLQQTRLTRNFLSAMSETQISVAKKRLAMIKNAPDGSHLITGGPSMPLFEVYRMLLEEKRGEFTNATVLFLGLPDQSITNALAEKLLEKDDAAIEISVAKTDQALQGVEFQEIKRSFVLQCTTSRELVDEAFAQTPPPTNFSELITAVKFNYKNSAEPVTGEEIIFQSNNPSAIRAQLRNELESFVLKSMYQEITGFSLSEDTIQKDPLEDRSGLLIDLTQKIMKPLEVPDAAIVDFFEKQGNNIRFPNMIRLNKLIQAQPTIVSGSNGYAMPVITTSEAETIYNLFSTKPFFVEKVKDAVLSQAVFDRVIAVFVDLDEFQIDLRKTVAEITEIKAERVQLISLYAGIDIVGVQ